MTPRHVALAASAPPLGVLLVQLWLHRVAVGDRAVDLMIRVLARRDEKAADW